MATEVTRTAGNRPGFSQAVTLAWLVGLLQAAKAFSFTASSSVGALRNVAVSSAPFQRKWRRRRSLNRGSGGVSSLKAIGVTSSVIESVAKGILNLALANPRQATVECTVNSSAMNLVRGNLEQAKVDGLNWVTPMGMTLRTIALTLNEMNIKPSEVFRGKILFKCPAEGEALIELDAQDFGNFLVHPLLTTADLPSGKFDFRREGTALDVERGRATFTGIWQGQPVVMEACQPDRFGKIHARVAQRGRLTDLGIRTLSEEMTHFFNTVVLDLDGTAVRFRDMYHGYNSRGEPSLRVTVSVVVHRLPKPENMKF
ncbi:unnamed protein product [Ectocarpus sp. 6 AP-2014]